MRLQTCANCTQGQLQSKLRLVMDKCSYYLLYNQETLHVHIFQHHVNHNHPIEAEYQPNIFEWLCYPLYPYKVFQAMRRKAINSLQYRSISLKSNERPFMVTQKERRVTQTSMQKTFEDK